MRRNNVTKKHYVLAFVGLMLAAPLAAKNHLPSEKVFPKRSNIYKKGWIDLNKNGKKDVYEDPTQEIQKRINDLIGRMTIEEKAGQLVTYYGYKKVMGDSIPTEKWKNSVLQHGVANIDEHLNGEYNPGGKLTGTWPKTVGRQHTDTDRTCKRNLQGDQHGKRGRRRGGTTLHQRCSKFYHHLREKPSRI